jgi:hypothetical protein
MERVPMRSTEEGLEGMNEKRKRGQALDYSASLGDAKQQDGRRWSTLGKRESESVTMV